MRLERKPTQLIALTGFVELPGIEPVALPGNMASELRV
jgi:hypothetical protein